MIIDTGLETHANIFGSTTGRRVRHYHAPLALSTTHRVPSTSPNFNGHDTNLAALHTRTAMEDKLRTASTQHRPPPPPRSPNEHELPRQQRDLDAPHALHYTLPPPVLWATTVANALGAAHQLACSEYCWRRLTWGWMEATPTTSHDLEAHALGC